MQIFTSTFSHVYVYIYMGVYVHMYIYFFYAWVSYIAPMRQIKDEFPKRLENFLKSQKTYKLFLSLFLFTAVCLCASHFIYYEIVYNSAHRTLGYLNQLSTRLPKINPRKAAILMYGLQGDEDQSSVDRLPPKMIDNLRKTLMDPRSFLMASYGTHLGRSDYVDAPVYIL
uniref:Wsv136-like protein n=1 Tax=Penaeus monodon majanivirus B TaxID=2984272 RepID=A0A9C7BV71_9VIRU|nr:MAG: wsv136-like protein [Penaeus monodon majanivirus B]